MVIENDRPKQPQAVLLIDHHARVAVRKLGVIGHQERLGPLVGTFAAAGPVDGHVVGRAFSRAAIPGNQQITVRTLHNSGRVVVLVVEWKNEFRFVRRLLCPSGGGKERSARIARIRMRFMCVPLARRLSLVPALYPNRIGPETEGSRDRFGRCDLQPVTL